MPTYSHIAKPADRRCRWWQKRFTRAQLASLDLDAVDGAGSLPGPYLRDGDDSELQPGDIVIDGEARHHRHNRGWLYLVGIVTPDASDIEWHRVDITSQKQEMKTAGWPIHGSGPIAAAVRLALWLTREAQD